MRGISHFFLPLVCIVTNAAIAVLEGISRNCLMLTCCIDLWKTALTLAFNRLIGLKQYVLHSKCIYALLVHTNSVGSIQRAQKDLILMLFSSIGNENEQLDGTGWLDKPIKNWCQEETINWLMSAASYIGQPYSSIQHSLAVPGKEIVTFTREDFINHDPIYGDLLYDLLHSQRVTHLCTYTNFRNEYS